METMAQLAARELALDSLRAVGKVAKRTTSVGGPAGPGSYAYVGNKSKAKSFKLRIDDAGHTKAALGRFNQTKGIPAAKKAAVKHKIIERAKHFGMDPEGFAKKHGMKAARRALRAMKALGWDELAASAAAELQKVHAFDDEAAPEEMEQEFPKHNISVIQKERSPEQTAQRKTMLRRAIGGPQDGFATSDETSHRTAMGLARSGHLQHMGTKKLANNHTVHHWQLTQKGMALAYGGSGMAPMGRPNMAAPQKPGMPGAGGGGQQMPKKNNADTGFGARQGNKMIRRPGGF